MYGLNFNRREASYFTNKAIKDSNNYNLKNELK